MALSVPGCRDCAKTRSGGQTTETVVEGPDRYEVRNADGTVIGTFRSIVAASTFMRGHPGSSVHKLSEPVEAP